MNGTGYYNELNDLIKKPAPNEYYNKIVQYCLNKELYHDLLQILTYPSLDTVKYSYDHIIYAALDIPSNHELTDDEWQEIADYLK